MNALPIVVGLLALGVALVMLIRRRRARRPGLVAAVISLALVSPVCSIGAGTWAMAAAFRGIDREGGAGIADIASICLQTIRMASLGTAVFLFVVGTGALLVVSRGGSTIGSDADQTTCRPSGGRIAILLGLSCLGPILAGTVLEAGSRLALLFMRIALPMDLIDPSEFAGVNPSQLSTDLALRHLAIMSASVTLSLLLLVLAGAGYAVGSSVGASKALEQYGLAIMLILCLVAGGYIALSYSRMSWIEEMTRITLSRDAATIDRP